MLILSLFWLALGLLIGALGLAARLRPASWGRWGWLMLLGVGALAALLGGLLGSFLYSKLFGTPSALWFSILVIALVWLVERRRQRRRAQSDV